MANEHIYLVPKSRIESYDGAQLILKIRYQDLQSFEEKHGNKSKGESTLDNIADKIKEAKEQAVNKAKDLTGRAKDTIDSSIESSPSSSNSRSFNSFNQDIEYEQGTAGINKERKSDLLTQYEDKEPMTPAKINEVGPTAVRRDSADQNITSVGQTGTNTSAAQEEYRKRGMTKVDSNGHSHESSSCSCGH